MARFHGVLSQRLQTIYWTTFTGGTVARVPRAGGTVEVLATGQVTPQGIAVDDRYVYWAGSGVGGIRRLAR